MKKEFSNGIIGEIEILLFSRARINIYTKESYPCLLDNW